MCYPGTPFVLLANSLYSKARYFRISSPLPVSLQPVGLFHGALLEHF